MIFRLEGLQRRLIKMIKRVKNYNYRKRFKKLGLITLLEKRIRSYLIETFKITNGISNYGRHFFNISLWTGNLLSRQILKTKLTNQLDFFAYRLIYFRNKLPHQIKNSHSFKEFKIKLDDFRKK